nr:RNA-dependent RNA polymerase [Flumine picornavirus 11]
MSLIRGFNTTMAGVRNLKSVFDIFVKHIPDFIKSYFNPYLTVDWLKSEMKNPRSLAARLTEACLGIRAAVDSGVERDEIIKIKHKAMELLTEFEMFIIENEVYKDQHLIKWLGLMRELINSSLQALTRESEPFCIRISGPPGCGKSSYWTSFVSPLFQGLTAGEIEQMTYTRNPNTEFFDGLDVNKHDILLYDDFLQGTEELDLTEIISVVSKSGFIPPMASVDSSNQN